jgi:hypothetical protein
LNGQSSRISSYKQACCSGIHIDRLRRNTKTFSLDEVTWQRFRSNRISMSLHQLSRSTWKLAVGDDNCANSRSVPAELAFIRFLVKLDLRWDIQQPITIEGWGQPKPSIVVWQRYETFVSEQFSVVTFSHCEYGLNHITRL